MKLLDEVDLHVFWMLVLLSPIAFLGGWWMTVLLVVPQGRILVRTFVDRARSGGGLAYLVANEMVVLFATGSVFLLRAVLGVGVGKAALAFV